jgi:hypothetical protein
MQEYTFSKTDGAGITETKAQEWAKRFRDKHPGKTDVIARFIGTDMVKKILEQDQCVGMRIYFGYDETGQIQVFLCGARADGSNIWPDAAGSPAVLMDGTLACPPYCPR